MLQLVRWDVKPRSLVKVSMQFLVKMNMLIQDSCPSPNFNGYVLYTCVISVLVESYAPLAPALNCSKVVEKVCVPEVLTMFAIVNRMISRNNGLFWDLLKSRESYLFKKCQVKTEKHPVFLLYFYVCRIAFWLEYICLLHGWVCSLLHIFIFHRIQVPCMFKICIFWRNGFTSCDVFDKTKDNLQW